MNGVTLVGIVMWYVNPNIEIYYIGKLHRIHQSFKLMYERNMHIWNQNNHLDCKFCHLQLDLHLEIKGQYGVWK